MSGEDVYDVCGLGWCELCDAAHEPCDEPDVDELDAEIDLLDHLIAEGRSEI